MNEQIISKLAIDEACKPSLLALRNMSTNEMLEHYIKKIDFSICSDLMDANFFLENSSIAQRYKAEIYVNDEIYINNPNIAVMVGKCKIDSIINGYHVSQIFMRDNSICNLTIEENAYAIIDCFGDSKIYIDQKGSSNVCVNLYGNAICDYTGSVKINHKLKNKY